MYHNRTPSEHVITTLRRAGGWPYLYGLCGGMPYLYGEEALDEGGAMSEVEIIKVILLVVTLDHFELLRKRRGLVNCDNNFAKELYVNVVTLIKDKHQQIYVNICEYMVVRRGTSR